MLQVKSCKLDSHQKRRESIQTGKTSAVIHADLLQFCFNSIFKGLSLHYEDF